MLKESRRITSIDGLRGFAITCMFYAHLIPHFMKSDNTLFLWERIISSIAAPLFLFLVGYNFNIVHNFVRVFKRTVLILFVATIIDVCVWHIFPFYSFDVLYLIGISLVVLYLIKRFNRTKLLYSILTILIVSITIQFLGFYNINLDEPYLNENYIFSSVLINFFINGWFPFFPWIIFPLAGFLFQSISLEKPIYKIISTIIFLLIIPIMLLCDFKWRPFAVEIFYPPTLLYILFSISYLFFIWSNKNLFSNKLNCFLVPLGKTSLFLYILHLTVYKYFGNYIFQLVDNRFYCFFLFLIFFWFLSFLVNRCKYNWKIFQKSEVLQILLGK